MSEIYEPDALGLRESDEIVAEIPKQEMSEIYEPDAIGLQESDEIVAEIPSQEMSEIYKPHAIGLQVSDEIVTEIPRQERSEIYEPDAIGLQESEKIVAENPRQEISEIYEPGAIGLQESEEIVTEKPRLEESEIYELPQSCKIQEVLFVSTPCVLPLPILAEEDRQDILRGRWLSDDVMDIAQAIVQRDRPDIGGLYASAAAFTLEPLEPFHDSLFLQIINRSAPTMLLSMKDYSRPAGSHWLVISNFRAHTGCLHLYDSLFRSANSSVVALVEHLLSNHPRPRFDFLPV